jgi:hypothetical protein
MAVDIKPNDTEVLWVKPQSDTDARVPTADELAAGTRLVSQQLQSSRMALRPSGVLNRPTFTSTGKNVIIPSGLRYWAGNHPQLSVIGQAHTLSLPALADTVSSVSRYDRIYLCAFSAEVDDTIDPDVRLEFTWRNQSDVLQTVTKENTRRVRDYYAFVWASGITNASTLLAALQTPSGHRLTVTKSAAGAAAGALRIYPLDPNLVDGTTYPVISDSLELIELVRVWRVQATNQQGYFWGRTGEGNFEPDFHLQPSYRYVGEGYQDLQNRAREALWRLMRGDTLSDTPSKDRSVQNLVNGQVGTNLSAPGVATASPNGSTALANEQRVTFTNEAIAQTLFCLPVVTTDSGGNAVATVNFAGNSPAGSQFSASGHAIYDEAGADISGDGTFTGGGGTGALTWTAGGGASISPGDTAYLIPSIDYPSGSGFPTAGDIESVYLNSTALDGGNVRELSTDAPTTYENPAGSEDHIVVMDKGRAALAYILKKFTVSADGSGVVAMPGTARGVIAFISGTGAPTTRQDLPVITGLSAGASYDLLCYHAPPGSEQWQFQIKAARYAGSGESPWLNGARVATSPIAIAHSQIGGNTYSLGDASIQHEALGFRLPINNHASAIDGHTFNSKLQLTGEADPGNLAFREIPLPSGGSGVAQFRPGQVLAVQSVGGAQSQGLAAALQADGVALGSMKPKLQGDTGYQLAISVGLEKDGDYRLLVVVCNGGTPNQVNYLPFSSDGPAYSALDTFKLY